MDGNAVLDSALAMLKDMIEFIDSLPCDDVLVWESRAMPGSTLGKHIRHCHAHWAKLVESVHHSGGKGLCDVDYAARSRGGEVETKR